MKSFLILNNESDETVNQESYDTEQPSMAKLEWGDKTAALDNDPISFAVLICLTIVAMTYLIYKMKQKKNSGD